MFAAPDGLDEIDVGDVVPGVQRRLRQELLVRIQAVDVVGDGVGRPVMGQRVVVCPEAIDQIIGERRDGRDRLCGGRGGAPASGAGGEREGIVGTPVRKNLSN